MHDDRLDRLEARVGELERRAGIAAMPAASSPVIASVAPAPAPVPAPASAPRPAPSPPFGAGRFEAFVAGRGLQAAGALLVLLGVSFFLELAFTRGWIGPAGRVLLGLVSGSGLIAFAATRRNPAYRGLADALIAVGGGILYLSLWASVVLFPGLHVAPFAALGAMVAVTGLIGALSARRRSEWLGFLALLGGYLTPVLLAGALPGEVALGAYVLVLSLGALGLAARCGFGRIDAAALLAVVCYAPAFAPNVADGWREPQAAGFATLLFGVFASAWTAGYLRAGASRARLASLAANFGAYAIALALIFIAEPATLGHALLVLAAVAIGVAQVRTFPRALSRTYAYLGLGALTFALPALAHGATLVQAFTLEAFVVTIAGLRGGDERLARTAGTAYLLAGLCVAAFSAAQPPALAVPVALSYALWLAGGTYLLRHFYEFGFDDGGVELEAFARIAFDLMALAGLSRLALDVLGGPAWSEAVPSRAQFGVSLVWTGYATLLFVRGLRGRSALMRWEALALFAATILKAFAIDLANVDLELRVASFVTLGVALFAASAMYARAMGRAPRGDGA